MKTLLIDTSGKIATIVVLQGNNIIYSHQWQNTSRVGIELLEVLDEAQHKVLFDLEDIDRIAAHTGPRGNGGPIHFSALRTGLITATLLAQEYDKELVGITGDTLEEMISDLENAVPVQILAPIYGEVVEKGY